MTYDPVDRRSFLQTLGVAGTAGLWLPYGLANAPQAPSAAQAIKGKDAKLIVLKTDPVVLETPLPLLEAQRITPTNVLFVRNNQQLPNSLTLKPLPLTGWQIELTGLINRKVIIKGEDLAKMEQVEHTMVLQCCGNGRSMYAQAVKTSGTQWGRGAIGNVRFGGVPLAAILRKYGVKVDPKAKYLTAEGKDAPAPNKDDFEHSILVADAIKSTFLALTLNGEKLPAVHGGPVRLVTPGFYATTHIKWLSRLRFEKSETDNYNQIPRYRTPNQLIKPGTKIEYTFANSKPSWRMKIATMVMSPLPGAKLSRGKFPIRGVAFNDGSVRIDSVLVSFDRGHTWRRANLEYAPSPYAWYRWSYPANLKPGRHEIWARAVDSKGRSQPLDGTIFWNPAGYEWNGVEKVAIEVE